MTALNILHANLQFDGGNGNGNRDRDINRDRDLDRERISGYTGTNQYRQNTNTQYGGNTGNSESFRNTGTGVTKQGVQMVQSVTYGTNNQSVTYGTGN